VGGKALWLQRLLAADLPVPAAWVVTTEALDSTLREAGLVPACAAVAAELAAGDADRAAAAARPVVRGLAQAPLPARLRDALRRLVRRLQAGDDGGPGILAVRSSAVGEDGARSHAGQYASVLNVRGLDGVEAALRTVWASWYAAAPLAYRAAGGEAGGTPAVPPMAVVIQRLVLPTSSGIAFSVDPLGAGRDVVIESGLGLGEALAQGTVHADYLRVARPRQTRGLRIVARGVARKERMLVPQPPGAGELAERLVPEAWRDAPSLGDEDALALAGLVLAAEAVVGGPVDVEWARDAAGALHLVQARPITGLVDRPARPDLRDRPTLWTQRFSGERWTQLATPLGWSFMQPLLLHFIEWEDASRRYLHGEPPTRLYRGMPYFNITLFRHLAFRPLGKPPPGFLLDLFPPDEAAELRSHAPALPDLGVVASIFGQVFRERRWERYAFNPLRNRAEWAAFEPELQAATEELALDFATPAEGLAEVDRAWALAVRYMGIHLLSLAYANLAYGLLDQALGSWVGLGGEAVRSALVAEPGVNRTLATNEALWGVCEVARAEPAVEAALHDGAGLDRVAGVPGGARFVAAFDAFLAEYGHRSAASYELFATRWADEPEAVLPLVVAMLRSGGDPAEARVRRERERQEAEALVRSRLGRRLRRRVLPWRQAVFDRLLEDTRGYVALRENQRFAFDRLLLRTKRIFERIGALLERQGRLAAGEDLVFAEWRELADLAAGSLEPGALAARIEARRAAYEQHRAMRHPVFLEGRGDGVRSADEPPGERLAGDAIGPGRAEGTVRIVRSLADAVKLRPGDILVARSADPGWTPLFTGLSGLILELGSVLSHAAVVAREYGLPAVAGVDDATHRLRDGDRVIVDGDRGRVIRHRAEKIPPAVAQDVEKEGE
jgi:phosphohistidine swiveling domain-containing protein